MYRHTLTSSAGCTASGIAAPLLVMTAWPASRPVSPRACAGAAIRQLSSISCEIQHGRASSVAATLMTFPKLSACISSSTHMRSWSALRCSGAADSKLRFVSRSGLNAFCHQPGADLGRGAQHQRLAFAVGQLSVAGQLVQLGAYLRGAESANDALAAALLCRQGGRLSTLPVPRWRGAACPAPPPPCSAQRECPADVSTWRVMPTQHHVVWAVLDSLGEKVVRLLQLTNLAEVLGQLQPVDITGGTARGLVRVINAVQPTR